MTADYHLDDGDVKWHEVVEECNFTYEYWYNLALLLYPSNPPLAIEYAKKALHLATEEEANAAEINTIHCQLDFFCQKHSENDAIAFHNAHCHPLNNDQLIKWQHLFSHTCGKGYTKAQMELISLNRAIHKVGKKTQGIQSLLKKNSHYMAPKVLSLVVKNPVEYSFTLPRNQMNVGLLLKNLLKERRLDEAKRVCDEYPFYPTIAKLLSQQRQECDFGLVPQQHTPAVLVEEKKLKKHRRKNKPGKTLQKDIWIPKRNRKANALGENEKNQESHLE